MSSHRSEREGGFRRIKYAGISLPIRQNLVQTSEAWGRDVDNHLEASHFFCQDLGTLVESRQAVLWPDTVKGWVTPRVQYPSSWGDCHREFQMSFSFFIVFVFLFFFLWQNKFQLFSNESFPDFCLLKLMTKERVCWQKPALSKRDKVLAVCLYHRSKQCQEPKI